MKKKNPTYSFPFILNQSQIEWLRGFVTYKRKKGNEFFSYSNTDAFREGLKLLKSNYIDLPSRPEDLKLSTRLGRRQGSTNNEKKFPTSFSINQEDKNFIYDFIYFKSSEGKDYAKYQFFNELIEALKKEYIDYK